MQPLLNDIKPLRIGLNTEISKPVTLLSVKTGALNSRLYTLGNLSSTIGRAKSRKTAYESIIIGVLLGNNINIKKFTKEHNPENILLFDTEQQDYELKRIVNNIYNISGKELQ